MVLLSKNSLYLFKIIYENTLMDVVQWVPFYEATADKLLAYDYERDKTSRLTEMLKKQYAN